MMLTVLTYNIWGKFGPYNARYGNIVKSLERTPADIICLQEAIDPKLLKDIELVTGAKLVISDTDGTGLAVLSKIPFLRKSITVYKTQSPFESYIRKFERVQFKHESGNFLLYNTHLSWKEGDDLTRAAQVNQLLDDLPKKPAPVLFCGDFNCDYLTSPMIRFRDNHIFDTMSGMPDESNYTWDNTHPFVISHKDRMPDRRIDLILADQAFSKLFSVIRCEIVMKRMGPDGILPSDHYGVLTQFQVLGTASRGP